MPNSLSLSALVILITAVWGACLFALGIPLTWDHAKPYTATVAIVSFLLWLFDWYVWRSARLRRFVKIPDIQGTWRVELCSTYLNPETKQPSPPLIGYALVHQRFSKLSLRLMTSESSSHLKAYNFLFPDDRSVELIGAYQSDPEIHLRGRSSEIHYGAFKIRVSGEPTERLEGHYWTDRNTTGSIRYVERKPELYDSYNSAVAAFATTDQGLGKNKSADLSDG